MGDGAVRAAMAAILVAGVVGAAFAAWRAGRRPAAARTFLGHVAELRRRLLWAVVAFLAAATFAFSFRLEPWGPAFRPVPALQDNMAAQLFATLRDTLVPGHVEVIVTGPLDAFMAQFTLSLWLGLFLAMPAILWQAGRFLLPALQPREQRALTWFLLPAAALFIAGALFCYVAVLPFLFGTLYGYADPLGATALLHVADLVTFTFGLMVVFGLAFQLPLVMVGLSRLGLVAPATWARKWRHAAVGIVVVGAMVTDPTVLSQVMVAAPLLVLYALGIGGAYAVTTGARSRAA